VRNADGALSVGDIWPLTLEIRDTVFLDNGADFLSTNLQVGYMQPSGYLPLRHNWTEEQLGEESFPRLYRHPAL
jgi:hypothetical protein